MINPICLKNISFTLDNTNSNTVIGGINMEWTKGRKVMAVICGIAILFMIYGIVHFIIMNNQYNKVIEVIKQGDYTRAEEMLIDMNVKHKDNNLERSEFGRCSMLLLRM